MNILPLSDALVVFGATGGPGLQEDIPTLQAMVKSGRLFVVDCLMSIAQSFIVTPILDKTAHFVIYL